MGAACTSSVRLYCFGTDASQPVSLVRESARIAFVSESQASGGAGLAAFDQICNTDALNVGAPGTFHAALATTAAPALARFATGGPWVRPDGVTAIDATGKLLAPIEINIDGSNLSSNVDWCGATSLTTKAPGTAASCFDWTHSDATQGLSGNHSRSNSEGYGGITNSCANAMGVYCLQD